MRCNTGIRLGGLEWLGGVCRLNGESARGGPYFPAQRRSLGKVDLEVSDLYHMSLTRPHPAMKAEFRRERFQLPER